MNEKYNTKSGVQLLFGNHSTPTGSQTYSILPWLSTVPFIYHYDQLAAAILRQQKPQVIPKAAINSSGQKKGPSPFGGTFLGHRMNWGGTFWLLTLLGRDTFLICLRELVNKTTSPSLLAIDNVQSLRREWQKEKRRRKESIFSRNCSGGKKTRLSEYWDCCFTSQVTWEGHHYWP